MSDVALRFGAKDTGLDAQFRKTNDSLDNIEAHAKAVSSSIASSFKAVAGIAAAVGAANLAGSALEFADAQKKVQAQTGLTIEAAQRLSYIAGQSSVDVGTLTSGINKLERALGGFEEGSEKSADALGRLGLANERFRSLDPEQQFTEVAAAVAGLADQNQKVLAVTELFGKSGAELLPVLQAIGQESAALTERFTAIGGPVGQQAIDAVDQLGDEFATTGLAAKSLTTELLAIISPPIIAGLHGVQAELGAIRYLFGAGNDKSANIDRQIETLESTMRSQLALAARAGANADAVRAAITARFEKQIAELKHEQALLLEVGEGSPLRIPFTVNAPDSPAFEETDEQRKQRLDEERSALEQRIQMRASMHQIEEDMAFRSSLKIAEIDQKSIDESVRRATDGQKQKLEISNAFEYALEQSRQLFGLRQIQFDEDKNQVIIGLSTTLFSQLAAQNTKFAKAQQALAIATVIYDTARAVMRAFAELSYLGFAQAALMAATGALQIAKIKSTNYSASGTSSGSVAGVSGGGSAISYSRDTSTRDSPDVTSDRGATNVYISGMVTKEVTDYMIEGLRTAFSRDVIVMPTTSLQAQVIRDGA